MIYSFTRYLAAKKSVDDRALNRPVLESLRAALPGATSEQPLKVLELGAGIGTMLERLLEWQVLSHCDYLGIDAEAENIAHARLRLADWADRQGFESTLPAQRAAFRDGAPASTNTIAISRPGQSTTAQFAHLDLFDLLGQSAHPGDYDLLVAHAFLDLIDLPSTLPRILRLLKPGGLFYFTLNFDGETIFEPAPDPALEAKFIGEYHRSMDERGAGGSQTGRRLFGELARAGGRVINAGASDWVVFPEQGRYPGDETYFLQHILLFFEESLLGRVSDKSLADWLAMRRDQVLNAELVYIAHQMDFVGIRNA